MANASNVLQVVINGVNNTGAAFRQVGEAAVKMGAVVAGAMIAATVRAGQFERGVAEIATLLDGDVTPAIRSMRAEILSLSVQFGQTMGTLTKARYDIVSAGFSDAADAAKVLSVSGKMAIAGVATVAETANLLTTALNGLGASADDAGRVADVLFQTVRKGKTTMSALASSFGPVFATARVAGVSIEELGAAMATLTANGVDTAQAATALNMLMNQLAAPTEEAKKALDAFGINLDQGLIPALRRLSTIGAGGLDVLSQFVPSIEALKAAAVAAADIGKLNDNFLAMTDSAGQVNRAVGIMSETFGFKLDQLRSSLDALLVEVGTMFLPTAKKIVDAALEAAVIFRYMVFETDAAKVALREMAVVAKEQFREMMVDLNQTVGGIVGQMLSPAASMFQTVGVLMKTFSWQMGGLAAPAINKFADGLIETGFVIDNLDIDGLVDLELVTAKAAQTLGTMKDAAGEMAGTIFGPLVAAIKAAKAEIGSLTTVVEEGSKVSPSSNRDVIIPEKEGEVYGPPEPPKTPKDTKTDIENLRAQIEDLAKFTAEDFAQIAFSIGDAFGSIVGDIGQQLLGLREGPLMIGRAFKAMAAGIISDLARVIARMLVAKALMKLFGTGFLGGIFSMPGAKDGMKVPHAAGGYEVPGTFGNGSFPPIILPGSPGLDRTPVLAAGGELLIPRQRVNAAEKMLRKPLTSPRPPARSRGGRQSLTMIVQANRPFRTSEQIELRESVRDGLARGGRYSA